MLHPFPIISLLALTVSRNVWLNHSHLIVTWGERALSSGSKHDLATCTWWGCLTLENNGMSSWLCSRVWRAYSTGVRVSNVARVYGCDPGLGGTTGSLPFTAETAAGSWIIWVAHHRVMSTLSCLVLFTALVFQEGCHDQMCEYIMWGVHCLPGV